MTPQSSCHSHGHCLCLHLPREQRHMTHHTTAASHSSILTLSNTYIYIYTYTHPICLTQPFETDIPTIRSQHLRSHYPVNSLCLTRKQLGSVLKYTTCPNHFSNVKVLAATDHITSTQQSPRTKMNQCLLLLGHDLFGMALPTPDLPGQNQFSPKVTSPAQSVHKQAASSRIGLRHPNPNVIIFAG